jgi:hypothetical protein
MVLIEIDAIFEPGDSIDECHIAHGRRIRDNDKQYQINLRLPEYLPFIPPVMPPPLICKIPTCDICSAASSRKNPAPWLPAQIRFSYQQLLAPESTEGLMLFVKKGTNQDIDATLS